MGLIRQVINRCWPGACAWIALLAWIGSLATYPAHAEHDAGHGSRDFEVFVAGERLFGSGQPHPRDDDSWFNADVVLALSHDQFRVFGEYFITPREHEFERLQLGYEFAPDTVLWLGRFHQAASAWNTEHHHGRYLQTAITRPQIENWEDEEGLIPQHITGALLESRQQIGGDSGLQLAGGVGVSPALSVEDGYQPITPVGNNPGKHGVSYSARVGYLPDYVGASSTGVLFTHDQIFVKHPENIAILHSVHATLNVYGAYADWSLDAWRLIGAGYYVDIGLDRPNHAESFLSGYVQAERQLPHALTAFGRVENSARLQNSRYVKQFNDHSGDIDITLRRIGLGLRWDFWRRQAFTVEADHIVSPDRSAYEARLQWSAAIP